MKSRLVIIECVGYIFWRRIYYIFASNILHAREYLYQKICCMDPSLVYYYTISILELAQVL